MRKSYLYLLIAITPTWLYAQEPQVWETGAFSCVAGVNGETQAGEGEETDGISWQAIAGQPFDVTVETDTWLSGNVEVATSKREAEEIQSIQLDKSALALEEGKGGMLTVTLNAEETANKTLIWHSSDESVATVNEAGEVKALQSGTATLTVTSASGNFYAECEVTVKVPESKPTPEPDPDPEPDPEPEPMPEPDPTYYRVDLRPMEGATILPASNMVEEGGTLTFTIQIEEGYVADEMVVTVS